MGSANHVSIVLFLLLCVNFSIARKFFYEHHAHHSTLHPYHPEQPDEVAHYRQIGSEPEPEQRGGHSSEWATMWSTGQVIAEEPPKGGSDPQDFDSVVLVAEPDHPPQKGLHPHGSVAYSIASEPPTGGSDPHDFGPVVLGASPEPSPRGFFYPHGAGLVAYYQQMAGKEGHGVGYILDEEPKFPPKGM